MKPPTISVNVYDPLVRDVVRGEKTFRHRLAPDRYSHTISAFGGYDSATMTIACTHTEAEEWLESGLMRDVRVFNPALNVIWEGFVDEVRANMGPLTATYGPVTDIANSVSAVYTPLMEGAVYSVAGMYGLTAVADDTDSQDRFGIFPVIINVGEQRWTEGVTDADYLRDVYLEANRWPTLTQDWADSARDVTVTLKCTGYFHLLDYHYAAILGASDRSALLSLVLTSNPNVAWLDFDTTGIETNTLDIIEADPPWRTGLSTIKKILETGDATTDDRWLFYIRAGLKAFYHAAPTEPEYHVYLNRGSMTISSDNQGNVAPWDVLPGKWLKADDFLVGRNIIEVRTDPRMMFIERVTYTAPLGIKVNGGKTDEINQIFARYGLGGVS